MLLARRDGGFLLRHLGLAGPDLLVGLGAQLEGVLAALELGVLLERVGLGLRGLEELLRLGVGERDGVGAALLRHPRADEDAADDAEEEPDDDVEGDHRSLRCGFWVRRAPDSVTRTSTCSSSASMGTAGTIWRS